MVEEKEIFQKSFVFSSLRYISFFLLLLTGFIVTKYLGPAGFGVYSAMLLILKYSTFSFMGFYSACFKIISFMKGKKRYNDILEIRDSTFAPSFYITLLLSISVFISSFFLAFDKDVLNALRLVSVLILLQQVYYFYTIYLRIDKEFTLYGIIDLLFTVIRILCIIIFLKYLNVLLMLTALIAAYIITLIFGFVKKPYLFRFRFKKKKAKEMFIFGLPTTILGTLDSVFISADKLMIIRYFDRTLLGLYSFAVLVVEIITYIPVNISIVILPSQLERSGANESNIKIKNMSFMPMMVVSYLLPIVIGGAFFFSEPVVNAFLPKYMESLHPLQFLIFGAFFLSNQYILENFIISLNKEKKILLPKLFFMLLLFLLTYLAINKGYSLYGIALCTTAVYAMYFIFLSYFSFGIFTEDRLEKIKNILILLFPFVYMVITLSLLRMIPFGSFAETTIVSAFIIAGIKYLVFLILNIPLFYYLNKKTGVIKLGFHLISSHIKKGISRTKKD
jgi:O-antigen/teichoic acid export membrane protein